jgi:hypothetical protein
MEVICLSNQAASAGSGNGATNRSSRACVRGSPPTMTSARAARPARSPTVSRAATNGTQRALTKALIDSVDALDVANAGGEPEGVMMSATTTRPCSAASR